MPKSRPTGTEFYAKNSSTATSPQSAKPEDENSFRNTNAEEEFGKAFVERLNEDVTPEDEEES